MQVHGSKVVEIIEVRVVWTNLHEVHGIFGAQVLRMKQPQARTISPGPGDVLSADVEQRRSTSNCKHANARAHLRTVLGLQCTRVQRASTTKVYAVAQGGGMRDDEAPVTKKQKTIHGHVDV